METWTRRALLIASAVSIAHASPALKAEPPVVTPAALLPRSDFQVLGWYSSATVGTDTFYAPWQYDADSTTYSTSGDYFRRCAVGSTCAMYTSCSNGYMVAESTSSSCGAGGASGALFCSYHVIKSRLGVTSEKSWFWCDEAPLTGVTFFAKEPSQPNTSTVPSPTEVTTTKTIAGAETSPRTPGPSASQSTSSPTSSPSSPPESSSSGGSSSNTGAIAGGVVGGVVGLAAIAAGIFFFMRRKKKHAAASELPAAGYATAPSQPGYPASPNMGYAQANEAKPVGVQEGGFYAPQTQAPYPQGPYDPHMSYASAPPQEVAGNQPGQAYQQHQPQMPGSPQELPGSK